MSEDDVEDLDQDAPRTCGSHKVKLPDGVVITLPTPQLSVTQVSMYLKCPAQYEFRYIQGKKSPPGVAQIEGTSGHDALEHQNVYQIMHEGRTMPVKKVLARYSDVLAEEAKAIDKVTWRLAGESKDSVQRRGERLLTKYVTEHAPKMRPTAAEQHFEMSVGGVPFQGYIDVAEKAALWDYKITSAFGASKLKSGLFKDLQLTAYSMATGIATTGFITLRKDKEDVGVIGPAKRSKQDHRMFTETVVRVAKAISLGAFPQCLPDSWFCSEKWCGFWKGCRGKYA